MSNTVLFPTDFSSPTPYTLSVALTFAEQLSASLRVFHGDFAGAVDHTSDIDSIRNHVSETGIPFEYGNGNGRDIADVILDEIKSNAPQLVVMSSHGRHPLANWMLGSVSERIMRYSESPVVLVTPNSYKREWKSIRTILVGIDFSLESRHALAWASTIAKHSNAVIHVMHTIESGVLSGTPFEFPSMKNLLPNATQTVLEAFRNFDSNIQFTALPHHHVCNGLASREIVKLAETVQADLLVIGAHGSGGMKDFLIGSTTDRVVRTSPCPVMIAKVRP